MKKNKGYFSKQGKSLIEDQRKQKPSTTGSSIKVGGSAQIKHDQLVSNKFSVEFQKDFVNHEPPKKQKTTPKCPSMSLDDYFKRSKQPLEAEESENEELDREQEVEVNHGCDEHLFDNSEEEEEEHLFDDLEEDEEYIV
ncbi:hypothetical protein P8452_75950 [Trifolium repens]|nr:hypothetical protein P8452_75950 [Trifolium repens]